VLSTDAVCTVGEVVLTGRFHTGFHTGLGEFDALCIICTFRYTATDSAVFLGENADFRLGESA
jgi:hypothetical protein